MFVSSGKVYAVGGHDGNEHLGNMEMFDPLTNKWMMKASMNTKRYTDTMIIILKEKKIPLFLSILVFPKPVLFTNKMVIKKTLSRHDGLKTPVFGYSVEEKN